MGEIIFVGTGVTRGYPYLVCKKDFSRIVANSFLYNLISVYKCCPEKPRGSHNKFFFFGKWWESLEMCQNIFLFYIPIGKGCYFFMQ